MTKFMEQLGEVTIKEGESVTLAISRTRYLSLENKDLLVLFEEAKEVLGQDRNVTTYFTDDLAKNQIITKWEIMHPTRSEP